MCRLPHEIGPCNEFRERWYFDYESGQCHRFIFGGCSGNENNFPSYADCEGRCGAKPEPKPEENDFKAGITSIHPLLAMWIASIALRHSVTSSNPPHSAGAQLYR